MITSNSNWLVKCVWSFGLNLIYVSSHNIQTKARQPAGHLASGIQSSLMKSRRVVSQFEMAPNLEIAHTRLILVYESSGINSYRWYKSIFYTKVDWKGPTLKFVKTFTISLREGHNIYTPSI